MPIIRLQIDGQDYWNEVSNVEIDKDGYMASCILHWRDGEVQALVLYRADADLKHWADYYRNTASGATQGFLLSKGNPIGTAAGAGVGLLGSFLHHKREHGHGTGYYDWQTHKLVIPRAIHTKKAGDYQI